jgi:hypothetical protein
MAPPLIALGAASVPLVTVGLVGLSVWTGGLVAIFVVARTAARTLDGRRRVDFFRALGRSYAIVGNTALAVTLACGALLLRSHPWTPAQVGAVAVAGALILATAVGMLQARAMTRLRRRALEPGAIDAQAVRNGARLAAALRGTIGILTLALIVLAATLAQS